MPVAPPNAEFAPVFSALKAVLARHAKRLAVKTDTATEYALHGRSPSPFPQHKGHPLEFAAVRVGKAYVSFHLLPVYSPELAKRISPELKKRMQGKTCFNFKKVPEPEQIAELNSLADEALRDWTDRKWI